VQADPEQESPSPPPVEKRKISDYEELYTFLAPSEKDVSISISNTKPKDRQVISFLPMEVDDINDGIMTFHAAQGNLFIKTTSGIDIFCCQWISKLTIQKFRSLIAILFRFRRNSKHSREEDELKRCYSHSLSRK
jgi:hypothetical protein